MEVDQRDLTPLGDRAHHRVVAGHERVLERQVAALHEGLLRCERHGAAAFGAFAAAVDTFVAFEREHMGREEREAFPLAQRHLTGDDWEEIDEAFAAHADPLHGVSTQDGFADLHRRLTRLHGAAGESAREP